MNARALPALALGLAVVLALAGCGLTSTPAPQPTAAVAGPIVSVTLRGGRCANGPCDSTVTLDRDGVVRAAEKPPNELGRVPVDKVTVIAAFLGTTDFDGLRSHPFTGQCPTAFDGQEVVFTFWVGARQETIEGCTTAIDWGDPLFTVVAAALAPFITLPTP